VEVNKNLINYADINYSHIKLDSNVLTVKISCSMHVAQCMLRWVCNGMANLEHCNSNNAFGAEVKFGFVSDAITLVNQWQQRANLLFTDSMHDCRDPSCLGLLQQHVLVLIHEVHNWPYYSSYVRRGFCRNLQTIINTPSNWVYELLTAHSVCMFYKL